MKNQRKGFTLVEILIVVVIMAVLAATIIPQFSTSSDDAKVSQRDFNRQALMQQIQLYKLHHGGDYPTITAASLPQLVNKTDEDGTIDNTNGEYGPYLVEMPINPSTNSATVTASTDGTNHSGGGWLYDAATGRVWADQPASGT